MNPPRLAPAAVAAALAASALFGPGSGGATRVRPSGDWPPVTEEERALARAELDPQADIVILNNERHGKILRQASEWVNVLTYHWRAKVLTEAGKRFAEMGIPGGKRSRVTNIQARTIRPDGTIVAVAPDQIFERTARMGGGVKLSRWVFNFPSVEPGAIIEYRYDRHDDYLVYVSPFYFEGPGPTLKAAFSQAIPEAAGFQILCGRCPPGAQPTVKKWVEGPAKGKIYELALGNLSGYEDEMMMPPRREVSPRLEMVLHEWKDIAMKALGRQDRFFIDWDSVAQYADYYFRQAAREGQTALKAAVAEWTAGLEDPKARTAAVLRTVREGFRYLPYDYVVGYSRSIASILKERITDNEEKAVLLWAALEEAGIKSNVALVVGRDAGAFNPDFFSLSQFTHAVVALPKGDGSFEWLDPTVSYAPQDLLSWRDSGATALLLEKGKGRLVELPTRSESSRTRYEVSLKVGDDGLARLAIAAEYDGEDAVDVRGDLTASSPEFRKDYFERWLRRRTPGGTLVSHRIENIEKVDEPLRVSLEATAPGLISKADEGVLVRGCVVSGFESTPIRRTDRRHPLYVDRGWNVQETVLIETPPGTEPAAMPDPLKVDGGVAKISFQCSTTLEGAVRCSRTFFAPRKHWPATHMENLRKVIDLAVKADRSMVPFQAKTAEGS